MNDLVYNFVTPKLNVAVCDSWLSCCFTGWSVSLFVETTVLHSVTQWSTETVAVSCRRVTPAMSTAQQRLTAIHSMLVFHFRHTTYPGQCQSWCWWILVDFWIMKICHRHSVVATHNAWSVQFSLFSSSQRKSLKGQPERISLESQNWWMGNEGEVTVSSTQLELWWRSCAFWA